jgi:hypothetical protein
MLRVYAAWAEGAVEFDVDAIKRSMNRHARLKPVPQPRHTTPIGKSPEFGNLAVDLQVETGSKTQVPDNRWKILAGERDSNRIKTSCRISNLLILKKIRSPTIPRNPHSCRWSCH